MLDRGTTMEELLTLSLTSISEIYPTVEEYRRRLDIAPASVLHYVLMGAIAGYCAGVSSVVPHA